MSTTIFDCPAKVNLALSVGSPDATGYHPIASWMVAVDLCDQLQIEPRTGNAPSIYHIDWAEDAPQPSTIDWPLRSDLAVRAHRLLEQHVGRPLRIRMRLLKRIPVGAGLAGGSSDAVAMLRGLDQVFDLQLSLATLHELAMQLGSDLGFFLSPGSAVVTGRGEQVEPIAHADPIHLVLILPPLTCPTGAVYRAFDEVAMNESSPRDVDLPRVRALAEAGSVAPDGPFNDLAEPAMTVTPDLRGLRDRVAAALDVPIHITGSGAGLFALAADADHAHRLAEQLRETFADAPDRPAFIPTRATPLPMV